MSGRFPRRQSAGGGQLASPKSGAPSLEQFDDPHVSRVASAPSSPEALLIGVLLGALAAVLMVFAAGYGPGEILRGLGPTALFLGVWVAAAWLVTRDTGRVLVVLRRGFFLGALQWSVLALRWAEHTTGGSDAASADTASIWPTLLMRDATSVLVWVCVAGFVLCWLATRSPYRELESYRP